MISSTTSAPVHQCNLQSLPFQERRRPRLRFGGFRRSRGRLRSCAFALFCALIALVAGCAGGGTPPPPPPPSFSVGKLYVANSPSNGSDTLLRFNAGNSGDVAPELKFDTSLQPGTQYLSLDVTHDRLAGFSIFANSIMVVDNVSSAS